MKIELRQVRIFIALSEELHFGRTAQNLYLPQSVVSQQVKRLERALGVSLFDRTRRRIELTCEGRQLIPLAIAIIAAEERLMNEARVLERRHREATTDQ